MSQDKHDPALIVPDEIKVYTPEGNLALMTELVAQAKDAKRRIEQHTAELEKWTRRVQVALTQPEPALREEAEAKVVEHKRELLKAQMDLAGLEDKKAELRFQHNAPSAEQKFRTAQAQELLNSFQQIGIDPDDYRVDKETKRAEAAFALEELKARAQASQALSDMAKAAPPKAPAGPAAAAEVTPGDLRRGAPLAPELKIKGKLWRRVDAVQVGDKAAEEAHGMSCAAGLERTRLEATFPSGRGLADDGVIHKGPLELKLSGLTPGQDLLLLLRLDVGAAQEVETLVDGAAVSTRAPEVDAKHRWRHETVLIPGAQVLMDDLVLTRSPKEGTAGNLYAVWAYQAE